MTGKTFTDTEKKTKKKKKRKTNKQNADLDWVCHRQPSNEIVIYTFFLRSVIFPYNSLYTQTVAYTTYFQLGEPVISSDNLCLFSFVQKEKSSKLVSFQVLMAHIWRKRHLEIPDNHEIIYLRREAKRRGHKMILINEPTIDRNIDA